MGCYHGWSAKLNVGIGGILADLFMEPARVPAMILRAARDKKNCGSMLDEGGDVRIFKTPEEAEQAAADRSHHRSGILSRRRRLV